MKDGISFLKNNRNTYLWILFIIVQQVLIVSYLKVSMLSARTIVVDYVILIFDLISVIYIYIASHIRKDKDVFLVKIILFVSLIIWQHLFVLNTNAFWYDLGLLLQPVITYIFTIGSFNFLLYEKTEFKKKIEIGIRIALIMMIPAFFINRRFFNLINLVVFFGLHLYPTIIMICFREYFAKILSKIRKECMIFAVFLLVIMLFNVLESFVGVGRIYSNIGWYIITITICTITYLRLIQDVLIIRIKSTLGRITLIGCIVFFSLIVFWIFLLYKSIHEIEYVVLTVGITEILIFQLILVIRMYFEYIKYISPEKFENAKFAKLLKQEEQTKEEFAEYLHDDILQSIIALKNITQISLASSSNKDLIVNELNNLVKSIRNEVDTQKPIINKDRNLKLVYEELIKSLVDKYNTNKKINFYCMDNIVVYPPYDSILYRILKELINNAIKHSGGYVIDISLDVELDNLCLRTINTTKNDEIKIRNGMDSICKRVDFLKGKINYGIEDGTFCVEIIIPMERSVCFEDIID